ncbi:AI-2E family transporter [Halogranum rubrum]|uniref:Permease n=1 Tax=Halogranum salarium B-1 TaxID=1210908 RepID=J3JGB2_9EURY|nr:AI-2E family transporter [Halogranum salarium]EJN59946.1 hypothetical protein HSB1_21040 [Halogranum salarium B-1]
MNVSRQYVLGGLFVFVTLLAAALLADVLSTVFFSVTLAYLLIPVRQQLSHRGLSPRTASILTTLAAFFGTLALAAPFFVVLVLRLEGILLVLESLPDEVVVELVGFTYTVTIEEVSTFFVGLGRTFARVAATAAPVLLVKFTLFGLLVFSLLHHQNDARTAMLALVPPTYRDVAEALNRRTRETLFAIYVLQAATALGTFVIALPVFFALGYEFPLTLAAISAVLQFIPIVGPSVLLAVLAGWHVIAEQVTQALLVFFVGGLFIAWLPDILIRPRLAKETANLPGSLYFVGFVGGLLSLGPIGFIAGPLVVALVIELANLLAAELRDDVVGMDALESPESPKSPE